VQLVPRGFTTTCSSVPFKAAAGDAAGDAAGAAAGVAAGAARLRVEPPVAAKPRTDQARARGSPLANSVRMRIIAGIAAAAAAALGGRLVGSPVSVS